MSSTAMTFQGKKKKQKMCHTRVNKIFRKIRPLYNSSQTQPVFLLKELHKRQVFQGRSEVVVMLVQIPKSLTSFIVLEEYVVSIATVAFLDGKANATTIFSFQSTNNTNTVSILRNVFHGLRNETFDERPVFAVFADQSDFSQLLTSDFPDFDEALRLSSPSS